MSLLGSFASGISNISEVYIFVLLHCIQPCDQSWMLFLRMFHLHKVTPVLANADPKRFHILNFCSESIFESGVHKLPLQFYGKKEPSTIVIFLWSLFYCQNP